MNIAGGARGGTDTDEEWPIKTASLAAAMAHSLALVKKNKKKKQQLQGSQPTQVQVFTGRVWNKEMNLSSNPYVTSE